MKHMPDSTERLLGVSYVEGARLTCSHDNSKGKQYWTFPVLHLELFAYRRAIAPAQLLL